MQLGYYSSSINNMILYILNSDDFLRCLLYLLTMIYMNEHVKRYVLTLLLDPHLDAMFELVFLVVLCNILICP